MVGFQYREHRNHFTHRFEQNIKRTKISTFANEGKNINRHIQGKAVEVKLQRDVFGRVLTVALEEKIDMSEVFKYPLTEIPLSLCHIDGTMQSVLMKELENRVESIAPAKIDCYIIDGFYFMHLLANLRDNFGDIAKFVLKKICTFSSNRVDIVFDRIITPSIKDTERNNRSCDVSRADQYEITGPNQKRPANFLKALRNDNFKVALVKFLLSFWESELFSSIIIGEKVLYVTSKEECHQLRVINGTIEKATADSLFSSHEEADSRIMFHVRSLDSNTNTVIKTCDTDILVIALGNLSNMSEEKNIWIETGIVSKNTLRYIHVNALHRSLGLTLSKALPTFHAFTGSDYTASFIRKGKVRPLKILEKNEDIQNAFAVLGESESIDKSIIPTIQKFVCLMYGFKNLCCTDEARFQLFLDKYKAKGKTELLSKIKGIDAASLPPSSKVLHQKIYRTHYIAGLWKSVTECQPPNQVPEDWGWILENNQYYVKWFDGSSSPNVEAIIKTPVELSERDSNIESDIDYNTSSDEYLDSDDE